MNKQIYEINELISKGIQYSNEIQQISLVTFHAMSSNLVEFKTDTIQTMFDVIEDKAEEVFKLLNNIEAKLFKLNTELKN